MSDIKTITTTTVVAIQSVPVATGIPNQGQILIYNSETGEWTPENPSTITSGLNTLLPDTSSPFPIIMPLIPTGIIAETNTQLFTITIPSGVCTGIMASIPLPGYTGAPIPYGMLAIDTDISMISISTQNALRDKLSMQWSANNPLSPIPVGTLSSMPNNYGSPLWGTTMQLDAPQQNVNIIAATNGTEAVNSSAFIKWNYTKGGPIYNLPDIAGLQLWLRADLGITQSDGYVSQWDDQSGAGDVNRNVIQDTPGQRPTLNMADAVYNYKPTLSFDSSLSQFMFSNTWDPTILEPYTIFVVGNEDDSGNAQDWIAASANPGPIMLDNGTGYHWGLYNGAGLDGPSGDEHGFVPLVFVGVFDGSNSTISLNTFTPYSTGAMGTPIPLGNLGFWLATESEYPHYLNGKIAEVIVYNSVLSPIDLAKVYSYLSGRYGITIGI